MDANEITRLLLNLVRKGSVTEVDLAAQQCRVQSGDLVTNWIPWITLRAGTTRTWNPPTVGEQVVMFSPGGDVADAVALCGVYSDDAPAPSTSADQDATHYPDGAVICYNHAAHTLDVNLPDGATININASGGLVINAAGGVSIAAAGNVTVAGDVIADGISLKSHVHGGVAPGGATTAGPQ